MSSQLNSEDIRTYIHIPYQLKDTVKKLGCWFDPERKLWYYRGGLDTFPSILKRYLKHPDIKYHMVAYEERDQAKAKGFKWCKESKRWYELIYGDE